MALFNLKNGEQLNYEDVGQGHDTVIMLHGWTSSKKVFKKPASLLKSYARCIYYDQRGHSGSKKAAGENVTMETLSSDLREIIIGLSLGNITLVGWSMGACVALNYLRMYGSEGLKNVVLCDMSPKLLNDSGWNLGLGNGKYTKEKMDSEAEAPFFQRYKKFAVNVSPHLARLPDIIQNLIIKKRLLADNEKVLESLADSMRLQDNRDVVSSIDIPLFFFYADPKSLFPKDLKNWYRNNAGSEYHSLKFPNSTHQFVSEYPEQFATAVKKVLTYH
ncbi:MAG: alpha/beta hydrolase [Lachnospiraceae bacterium]|nr:alpha/beta hydrolase [Lachnospiraceae bacterium]